MDMDFVFIYNAQYDTIRYDMIQSNTIECNVTGTYVGKEEGEGEGERVYRYNLHLLLRT